MADAARQMGVSRQTACKWLRRSRGGEGLADRPGELLHVDAKKVARVPDGGGHRVRGRGCGSARGSGSACLHVAVDDFSRAAYTELLPDECKGTCAAFMGRCPAFFGGGWAWRSSA